MSNVRIRYSKMDEQGKLTSRRVFVTADGQQVTAVLDTTTKTFEVKNVLTSATLVAGGGTINISVLKIKAKDALLKLGVDFAEENRRERGYERSTSATT